ncbi:uncharacterized protein FOMMEDRAFT_168866 [Fomitiporia mediterranea MF3/22]|uniref:uncharacterized protein n=1 Tax=Fomitiporia mediterranea (strain MF3/22) TaxID=694068 RepID=UPI0004408A5C|nr:uncharacterized protein FOMMEDRAFT_168866 [Fomitiporia mediterranea MF3/22]EJD02403.1 hypothetical protein FOMMEDRAFT_168866 [Fomitiporia mediterranea MF3/22]
MSSMRCTVSCADIDAGSNLRYLLDGTTSHAGLDGLSYDNNLLRDKAYGYDQQSAGRLCIWLTKSEKMQVLQHWMMKELNNLSGSIYRRIRTCSPLSVPSSLLDMSLHNQPPWIALPTGNDGRYLHLKAINVQFICTRLYPKVKIEVVHGSTFRYESDTFKEERSLHWDCDVYMRSDTKAVLSIHSLKGIGSQKLVDEVGLDLSSEEFGLNMTILYKGRESHIRLIIGERKSDLNVARLLVPGTVSALGSKVSMLRKLDRLFWVCELVVKLGIGASELNPHAKAGASMGASILTEVIKRFRDIPSFHTELVSLMENVSELLPIVELVIERVTDKEVQMVIQTFFDFVIDLAGNLKEYASKPRTKFILSNWYKPKGDEIRQIKDRLENLLSKLNLGMQSNILGVASAIRNQQISEADNTALKCLRPPVNSAFDPDRACLPGTRETVIRDIKQWIFSENHSQRLYWIYGVAGCGKSSVAVSVASGLDKALSGSFFCKRDIPERRSPARLICSLAYFLARSRSSFRKKLLQQLKEEPVVVDKPLSTQFKDLLLDPLSTAPEVPEPGPNAIIVIDALDECEENETVASYLISMARSTPWLRLIVTSRPIPGIERRMMRCGSLVASCDLFRMTTNEDIFHFTQSQFMSNDELPDAHPSQIAALVRRAAGHFIWISTVLKHLSITAFGKVGLLQQIIASDSNASNSEENLDGIYLRVLQGAALGSADRENAIKWIVGLVFVISRNRPLPSEALYAFLPSGLNAKQNEVKALIGYLRSVLYEDTETGAIRVCHPSFLDFIGSKNRSGQFWTASTELDLNMARQCLEIMLSGLKFNICNLETSYLPNADVVNLHERIKRCIPDSLQYSCVYWMSHLSNVQTAEHQLRSKLQCLLCSEVSLFWLEVLSLMGRLWLAKSMLRKIPAVLKV